MLCESQKPYRIPFRHRRGLVLVIVLGVLGILAVLAVDLAQKSLLSRQLSQNHLLRAKARVLARSGMEGGVRKVQSLLGGASRRPIHLPLAEDRCAFTLGTHLSPTGGDLTTVTFKDTGGMINVNDGLEAGLEDPDLAGSYQSNALNPWPTGNIDQMDLSAWINLRLRNLLNAYGDVHKYLAELGSPPWNSVFIRNGTPFYFTSTAQSDRGTSMPAGSGLGDVIVGGRPRAGYSSIQQMHAMIDNWGAAHLPPAYVPDGFFNKVSMDLTTSSRVDSKYHRIRREFGAPTPGGQAQKYWNYGPPSIFANFLPFMSRIDLNPPNLEDLWRKHPVALINLNFASPEVRSAVFYAPLNVSCSVEGLVAETYSTSGMLLEVAKPQNKVPMLGTANPMFSAYSIKENGVTGYISLGVPFDAPYCQKNRLMSLTDALRLSSAYEAYASVEGWPDSFASFQHLLKWVRTHGKRPYERALISLEFMQSTQLWSSPLNGSIGSNTPCTMTDLMYPIPLNFVRQNVPLVGINPNLWYFEQTYIERGLPHLLSPYRRLPGWLGAPCSLISEYMTVPSLGNNSVFGFEDFVYKSHLPKIDFLPAGIVSFRSHASLKEGEELYESSIESTQKVLEVTNLRSQEDFFRATDVAATSAEIRIGPEPRGGGVAPHDVLGFVGLEDRHEIPDINRPYSCMMFFDDEDPIHKGFAAETGPGGGVLFRPKLPVYGDVPMDALNVVGFGKVEEFPAPYTGLSYPAFSSPYTPSLQQMLDDLRTISPAPNRTWKVPQNPLIYWNSCTGLGYTEAEIRSHYSTMWGPQGLYPHPSYPGDGVPLDRLIWFSMNNNGRLLYYQVGRVRRAPVAYESILLPFDFSIYNQGFFDALRSGAVEDDRTWERLRSPAEILSSILNSFIVMPGHGEEPGHGKEPGHGEEPGTGQLQLPEPPPGPNEAALRAYLELYSTELFPGGYPGSGLPLDAYSFHLHSYWSSGDDWGAFWINGQWS
ncbi:MAG: hypothetical protein AB7F75_02275, partial [Planctomycetota bacterium]